ncbi:MAG: hypothetical protein KF768_05150 [Phycisphaeraceae bacterium]|nr:hypothetical protein [Phycisphaeraceae bacterium]
MVPKPHVSQAIKGLRRWVVLSALVVGFAAAVQGLVFGFVHYTDIRHTTVEAAPPKELKIVESSGTRAAGAASVVNQAPRSLRGPGQTIDAGAPATPVAGSFVSGVRGLTGEDDGAVEVNRVASVHDGYLRRASTIATVAGSIAALTLAMMVFMGTVIAGGGAVPGVERAVTASFWAIVLGILCVPWKDLMPSMPIPGVFSGYEGLVTASEAVNAGGSGWTVLMAKWLVMPGVAALCATLVATWFCSGVRRGVIVTSVTELDRQVEREVAEISRRGVHATTPRTLGALNRAIGEVDRDTGDGLDRAASVASSLVRETRSAMNGLETEFEAPRAGSHPGRLI